MGRLDGVLVLIKQQSVDSPKGSWGYATAGLELAQQAYQRSQASGVVRWEPSCLHKTWSVRGNIEFRNTPHINGIISEAGFVQQNLFMLQLKHTVQVGYMRLNMFL